MKFLSLIGSFCLLGIVAGGVDAAAPFTLGPDSRVDNSQFRVTTFASNLPYYTTGLVQLPDGSYLVAASDASVGGKFYASSGKLIRLTDNNHDGVADGAGTVVASGLPGAITQMRLAGNVLVFNSVITNNVKLQFMRLGANPTDPLTPLGAVNFTFPFTNPMHTSYALAVRPIPASNSYDLFFNVGSRFNASNDSNAVATSGLLSASLDPESIYRATLTDTGSSVTLSSPRQIARGLRNAAGIAFQPGTGDLYFQDNGIDGLSDPNEPLSADELNRITAGNIGTSVPNFGFSTDYIQYRTGTHVGSGAVQPLVAFQPIPDPFTGSESEGATEVVFAPASFPASLNAGAFIGFHGKFNDFGVTNEENPVLWVDPATGQYFDFLSNDIPTIGHIDNLLTTSDSLFLMDINSNGNMFTSTPSGAIYQITVIPEPGMAILTGTGLALIFLLPRRRQCA